MTFFIVFRLILFILNNFVDFFQVLNYILVMINISLQRTFKLKSATIGPLSGNAENAYKKYPDLYTRLSRDLVVYDYSFGSTRWISVPRILLDIRYLGLEYKQIALQLPATTCRIVNDQFFIPMTLVWDVPKFEKFLCRDQRVFPSVKKYFSETGEDYYSADPLTQAQAWQRAEEEVFNKHRHLHSARRQDLIWSPLFHMFKEFAQNAYLDKVEFKLSETPKKKNSIWSDADDASLHQWYKPGYKKLLSEDEWIELTKRIAKGKFTKKQILSRVEALNHQTKKEAKTIKDPYQRRKFLKDNLLRRCGKSIPKVTAYDPSLPGKELKRRGPAKLDQTKSILAASMAARKEA